MLINTLKFNFIKTQIMITNIHLKIEAKNAVRVLFPLTSKERFFNIYRGLDGSHFLLPYEVQKLSKKARRNTFTVR